MNEILKSIDDASGHVHGRLSRRHNTIPYFKAVMIDGDYYIEGGYWTTRLWPASSDPEVDEIIACDFTDYYHAELDKIYRSSAAAAFNSIDTHLLVSDIPTHPAE